MCAKKYLSDNCYVDMDGHRLVRIDNGEARNLSQQQWRFLEFLIKNGSKHPVSSEEMAKYVRQSDNIIRDDANNMRQPKNRLKHIYTQELQLDGDEFDKIIVLEGGYFKFNPQVVSRDVQVSQAAYEFIGNANMHEDDLTEMLDCMLFQGISGKMGRHTLMALAKAENPFAMFEIGELYYHGYITKNRKPDFEKAHAWYEKASAQNHPGASWTIGYMIVKNFYPRVPEGQIDYAAALEYLNKALLGSEDAKASAAAMTTIGELWETGRYPAAGFIVEHPVFEKADIKKALMLYKDASDKGYHYAMNRLALHHEKVGFLEEAFSYFERSAALIADGYTYNKLGLMLENGLGCEKNPERACKCYIAAVEEVLPDDVTPWAMFNAARVYANLVPEQPARYLDLRRAFELFFAAMEMLPIEKHDQMLNAMLEILLFRYRDMEAFDELQKTQIIAKVYSWANRYLRSEHPSAEIKKRVDELAKWYW